MQSTVFVESPKTTHQDRLRPRVRTVPPAGALGMPAFAKGQRGVPLDMSRIHPECPDSGASVRSVAADVLVREAPDEEEDEEEDEGDGKEDDDDDKDDDGYSE